MIRRARTREEEALREALVNLLAHQDYADQARIPVILWWQDQVTFTNPGDSFVPVRNMWSGGFSETRNPLITRVLRQAGLAEQAGSGLPFISDNWTHSGRSRPQLDNDPGRKCFKLLFRWQGEPVTVDGEPVSGDSEPVSGDGEPVSGDSRPPHDMSMAYRRSLRLGEDGIESVINFPNRRPSAHQAKVESGSGGLGGGEDIGYVLPVPWPPRNELVNDQMLAGHNRHHAPGNTPFNRATDRLCFEFGGSSQNVDLAVRLIGCLVAKDSDRWDRIGGLGPGRLGNAVANTPERRHDPRIAVFVNCNSEIDVSRQARRGPGIASGGTDEGEWNLCTIKGSEQNPES